MKMIRVLLFVKDFNRSLENNPLKKDLEESNPLFSALQNQCTFVDYGRLIHYNVDIIS